MIDPPDPSLYEIYRRGDANPQPIPTGGINGEGAVGAFTAEPDSLPKIFRVFETVLTAPAPPVAGQIATYTVSDRPEYWIVSQTETAGAETAIWLAEQPAGPRIRIGPTGHASLPGITESLTVQAIGTADSTLTVLAVRGYPNLDIQFGG